MGVLTPHLPLGTAGYRCGDADTSQVVAAAAAQQRSIQSVCRQVVAAPSANRVRHVLAERLLTGPAWEALEARCTAALLARLPAGVAGQGHRLAVDLTLVPYYGGAAYARTSCGGGGHSRTTRFHCSATASRLRQGRRVTLALTVVHAAEAVQEVLADLLERVRALGRRIKHLRRTLLGGCLLPPQHLRRLARRRRQDPLSRPYRARLPLLVPHAREIVNY